MWKGFCFNKKGGLVDIKNKGVWSVFEWFDEIYTRSSENFGPAYRYFPDGLKLNLYINEWILLLSTTCYYIFPVFVYSNKYGSRLIMCMKREKYMSASAVKETLNPFEIAQKQVKIACDRLNADQAVFEILEKPPTCFGSELPCQAPTTVQ